MNQSIYHMADDQGMTTSDQVIKKDIIRRLMYTQANNLSVGTQIVGTETIDSLDIEFEYPGEMSAQYPVAMDSVTERERISWNRFEMSLEQGQSRYFMTDSAKLRGVSNLQQRMTSRRSGEALARRKDENIIGTIKDAAISENEEAIPNGEEWDQDTTDLVEEFRQMWEEILVNAPLSNLDVRNFSVVLPVRIWTQLNTLELINNVQQQMKDYLGQTFGFSLWPTKLGMHEDDKVDLQNTAIMIIPGSETAIHGQLSTSAASSAGVPLVETERAFGKGEDYLVKQWFNTGIMEHESAEAGKTPRVSVRTNVDSTQ